MKLLFVATRDGAGSTVRVASRMVSALYASGVEIADDPDAEVDVAIQYPLLGWISPPWTEAMRRAALRVCYARIESSRAAPWVAERLNAFDQVWLPSLWSLRAALRSGVDPRKVRWVPHGVDALVDGVGTSGAADTASDASPAFLCACTHGHFRRKGLDLALAAFRAVHETEPAAKLRVLTDRPAQVADMMIEAHVKVEAVELVAAPVPDWNLEVLYRATLAFLAPCRGGAFEMMPLEAIVAGCPVIVPVGLLDYATESNALLVSSRAVRLYAPANRWARQMGEEGDGLEADVEALVEAMKRVLREGREAWAGAHPNFGTSTAHAYSWDEAARRALEALSYVVSDAELPVATASVDVGSSRAHSVYALVSPYEHCGVREYGTFLHAAIRAAGEPIAEVSVRHRTGLLSIPPHSILLVHAEPGLFPHDFAEQLRSVRSRGRDCRVIFVCHYLDEALYRRYRSLVDVFVAHRKYPAVPELVPHVILHPCPDFTPQPPMALRAMYRLPPSKTILTTAGFAVPWKRMPEVVEAVLARMSETMHLQLLCSPHFSLQGRGEEARLRVLAAENPDRISYVGEFLSAGDLLNRIATSDAGFLYHGHDTGSVSGIARQFVAACCPLVVTPSSHTSDLMRGVKRTSYDLGTFAAAVTTLAEDVEEMQRLREEVHVERVAASVGQVAQQYIKLFDHLRGTFT